MADAPVTTLLTSSTNGPALLRRVALALKFDSVIEQGDKNQLLSAINAYLTSGTALNTSLGL